MNERLNKLIESANNSDEMSGTPLIAGEASLLYDYGWTHALEVSSRGFYLVEVKNTGWFVVENYEEAMKYRDDL